MIEGSQLRARRTRLKILKALNEFNGEAGFSEIQLSTGLSTGSIYYNLGRMEAYVAKKAKRYYLTAQGRSFLDNVDHARPWLQRNQKENKSANQSGSAEEAKDSGVSFAE